MSRRDELAAVLAEHRWWRSDRRCTCGWRPDQAIPQFPDPPRVPTIVQFEQHQADAVLAWLGEQLGDEGLREATARALCISVNPGGYGWRENRDDRLRDAVAALDVAREWFGVAR